MDRDPDGTDGPAADEGSSHGDGSDEGEGVSQGDGPGRGGGPDDDDAPVRADGPDPGDGTAEREGLDRRTLVRLLVGLGIGIPVLVEVLTFLGLVGDLFGDGDDEPSPTTTEDGIDVGEELLPETDATDRVEAAYVRADGWELTLTVAVENDGEQTYELRLGEVRTDGGTTVEGGGTSGPVAPGETGTATGRWGLPDGASPGSVDVTAFYRNGTVTRIERTVQFGSVPVRGG